VCFSVRVIYEYVSSLNCVRMREIRCETFRMRRVFGAPPSCTSGTRSGSLQYVSKTSLRYVQTKRTRLTVVAVSVWLHAERGHRARDYLVRALRAGSAAPHASEKIESIDTRGKRTEVNSGNQQYFVG
jgi:hypothetical protein